MSTSVAALRVRSLPQFLNVSEVAALLRLSPLLVEKFKRERRESITRRGRFVVRLRSNTLKHLRDDTTLLVLLVRFVVRLRSNTLKH